MATRIPRTTGDAGTPPTPPTAPATPPSAPADETAQASVTPPAHEAKEVGNQEAPAPSDEKDTGEDAPAQPKFLAMAKADLDSMIEKLHANLDSLKAQKQETPDQMELLKLSCAKVLREATFKVGEMLDTVDKMKVMSDEMQRRQQGLDKAVNNINEKSAAYRNERDAFMKIKSLTEKEYYELVNHVAAQMKAEKEASK